MWSQLAGTVCAARVAGAVWLAGTAASANSVWAVNLWAACAASLRHSKAGKLAATAASASSVWDVGLQALHLLVVWQRQ